QTVNIVPIISSMSPAGGPIGMGFQIAGKNFGKDQPTVQGTVTVKGITATVLQWTDTQIVVQVPAGVALGADDVVVTANTKPSDPKTVNVTDRFIPNCTP